MTFKQSGTHLLYSVVMVCWPWRGQECEM